jgi:hypothetical protein
MSTRNKLIVWLIALLLVGPVWGDGITNPGGSSSIISGTTPITCTSGTTGVLYQSGGKVTCDTTFTSDGAGQIVASNNFSSTNGFNAAGGAIAINTTSWLYFSNTAEFQIGNPVSAGWGFNAAGVIEFNNGTRGTLAEAKVRSLVGGGSAPSLSGTCVVVAGTQAGGNTIGKFSIPAGNCAQNTTVILTFGFTAPNGWHCNATDHTTVAAIFAETGALSPTTATLTITSATAAVAADVVTFACFAF